MQFVGYVILNLLIFICVFLMVVSNVVPFSFSYQPFVQFELYFGDCKFQCFTC